MRYGIESRRICKAFVLSIFEKELFLDVYVYKLNRVGRS